MGDVKNAGCDQSRNPLIGKRLSKLVSIRAQSFLRDRLTGVFDRTTISGIHRLVSLRSTDRFGNLEMTKLRSALITAYGNLGSTVDRIAMSADRRHALRLHLPEEFRQVDDADLLSNLFNLRKAGKLPRHFRGDPKQPRPSCLDTCLLIFRGYHHDCITHSRSVG